MSVRGNEINNMSLNIFKEYLKDINQSDIDLYTVAKYSSGLAGHYSERTLKSNIITNSLDAKMNEESNFRLKLIELAYTFPNDSQWKLFAFGDGSNTENGPLSNEKLASFYFTSEKNVEMKKLLDEAIIKYNNVNDKPKVLSK